MSSMADIKSLRQRSGAGILDCKKALSESSGDLEQALDWLRAKGIANATKKAGRIAFEGLVGSYIHGGGKIGVLVEINCETDFVARTEAFRELARDVAMQVAAMNPLALNPEDVPDDAPGKKDEHALLTQPFIKDAGRTIADLVQETIATTGENVRITNFSRFELGS